ncbi:hypothetical protein Taro_041915 [Colocasia esculenta]|uniref:Uncharacterized protein n=1 Tax=Colocasia esculenta TaxID=4460 RepID=A0A843WFK4_COLES|nr:hypothetical protein [Colocasia esculenta]
MDPLAAAAPRYQAPSDPLPPFLISISASPFRIQKPVVSRAAISPAHTEMGKRLPHGSAICSRSPPVADHRRCQKLQEVIRRHQECKAAFQDLRSQIKAGLLEASDVFDSLSVPLMKLVGLKAEEMAKDGKSSTIIVNPDFQNMRFSSIPPEAIGLAQGSAVSGCSRWSWDKQGNGFAQDRAVPGELYRRLDEEVVRYGIQAKETCNEISEKQKINTQRLVRQLRGIGVHLNTRQESIHTTLDSTRASFCQFIERAASVLASYSRAGQQQPHHAPAGHDATVGLATKVLHAAYKHVSSALKDMEDEADLLLRSLAEATCGPMMDHITELRADAESGAPARLSALVGEMEAALRELRVETAVARKRARLAEEERAEAMRVCGEMQAALVAAAAAGSRKGSQSSRSPVPLAGVHGTNGFDGLNVRKISITSSPNSSSVEQDKAPITRRMVMTRSRSRSAPGRYQ